MYGNTQVFELKICVFSTCPWSCPLLYSKTPSNLCSQSIYQSTEKRIVIYHLTGTLVFSVNRLHNTLYSVTGLKEKAENVQETTAEVIYTKGNRSRFFSGTENCIGKRRGNSPTFGVAFWYKCYLSTSYYGNHILAVVITRSRSNFWRRGTGKDNQHPSVISKGKGRQGEMMQDVDVVSKKAQSSKIVGVGGVSFQHFHLFCFSLEFRYFSVRQVRRPRARSHDHVALEEGQEAHWEVAERILFIYGKLNPGQGYVQVANHLPAGITFRFC